jgi:hypothetical protein
MLDVDLDGSVDELEQQLLAREALIAALRLQQAEALRILDARQVHRVDGSRSLQEWVRARLDVADHTARDLVDVARQLCEQPALAERARVDSLSFSRVAATSRLVASGADERLIELSFGYDLAGAHRLRNRHRRITRSNERAAFVDRRVWLQDSFDGMCGRFGGELPGFEYRIFTKALEERADMFGDLPGPVATRPQRMADALVSISQDSLELPNPDGEQVHRGDPLATVIVDGSIAGDTAGEAGAEIEFGPRVGPAVLEQILCMGRVHLVGLRNGKPVVTSDAARAIPPAVRRLVAWRDGGCTIDGCCSRYRLQPHHIRPRGDGGTHDPENLTTLCWFHHHVAVHRLGLRIDPHSPPGRRRFLRNYGSGTDPP